MGAESNYTFSGTPSATKAAVVDSDRNIVLRWMLLLNTTAAVAYLQVFYKRTGDVTLGTTVPDLSIGLPASAAMVVPIPETGHRCRGFGLTLAGTTTRLGAVGAQIDANLGYD